MTTGEHRLEPVFDFTAGESSVLIHQSQAEICIDGNNYTGDGKVRLDFLPRANIYLYGSFQGVPDQDLTRAIMTEGALSSFSINRHQIEGFRLSSGGNLPSQEFNIKWCPKSEPIEIIGDSSTLMTQVVFHLFNFVNFFGTQRLIEQSGTKNHTIEYVNLICDEWNVDLKSLNSTKANIKSLKEEGGYRLTHIGGIKKADGTSFSGKDAHECLIALRFFLSFARGGWREPICAVGFDASDNRVWESWSSPKEPWHSPPSWFDIRNGSQLASLFPGFMKRWANDDWHEALHEAIYWYLNANNSTHGIDTGIILTQAAIERLSYEYVVRDRKLLTINGFKALWASDKFRLLFSSLGIPLDIPTASPTIQKLASKQMGWLDAPHALTEIRNSLVHPEHKHKETFGTAYYEAWNLGLWYLEMGILAICGYADSYGNRLKQRYVGQVEDIPWKK